MLSNNFDKAQREYGSRMPEEDPEECDHKWKHVGTAKDGTSFYRCTKCRLESEE